MNPHQRSVLLAGWVLCAVGLGIEPAAAFVEVDGRFEADAECPAFVSIRRQTNPDGIFTSAGTVYEAYGLNDEPAEWVQVRVPDADPPQRWISLDCGSLDGAAIAEPEPDLVVVDGLAPFFDDVDAGPGDPAPPAVVLSPLDKGVLAVCGPWGSRPRAANFRAMLDRPELAPEIEKVFKALQRSVTGGEVPLDRFKDELTQIWFGEDGFAHIFCGEPSGGTIGGLHFAGRYLELQDKREAGLLPSGECRMEEIAPPIYTIGVRYRLPGTGRLRTACPKGYALDQNAADLLIEATEGYKAMRHVTGKDMCLAPVGNTAGSPDYLAVLVVKNRAVRTFYPDASPACDGARPARTCLCAE